MQCLHCGKKLSFLRRLSDGRFCSDSHRIEYERLESDLALARLMGGRGRRVRPPEAGLAVGITKPPGSVLPMAPLLPEPLRAANWRKSPGLVADLVWPIPAVSLPESCLRPFVRGLPMGASAAVERPAGSARAVFRAPRIQLAAHEPLLDSVVGLRKWPASPGVASAGREEHFVPPPMAGFEMSTLVPVCSAMPAQVYGQKPVPLPRRRLVVALPRRRRSLGNVGLRVGGLISLPPAPAGAETGWALPVTHGASMPWPVPVPAFPSMAGAARRPAPEILAETGCALETQDRLPPPIVVMRALSLAGPVGWLKRETQCRAEPLPWDAAVHKPAFHCGRGPKLPEAGLQCADPRPVARPVARAASGTDPQWNPAPAEPLLPELNAPGPHTRPVWPERPSLAALTVDPIAGANASGHANGAVLLTSPAFVAIPAPEVTLPELRLPDAGLLHWQSAACVAFPRWEPHVLAPEVEWSQTAPLLPRTGLELIPPEPEPVPEPALFEQAGEADSGPTAAAAMPLVPSAAGQAELPVKALPTAAAADAEPLGDGASIQAEPLRMARRVPEMPLRPLDSASARTACLLPSTAAACWPSLEQPRPFIPRLRFELDHADGSGPRRPGAGQKASRIRRKAGPAAGRRRFWVQAPSDLKWIAVVLPLLLVIVVYSFRSKAPNLAEGNSEMATAQTQTAPSRQESPLNALQRVILRRAAVRLFDDFRSGLGAWEGREGWARTWRYGDATFIEPGDLALLTPSLRMSDYTLTFLGQIERRSLNWVFRAKDLSNYYSMRIVITRGGPLPEAAVVRSVVINGREQEVRTMPIPFPVRADTLYLVRMDVRGQDFTTYIQDQVVDHFSDSRFSQGGVGFYSPKGDRAMLRWVEVSHQYDYLGRLCALLAPYGVQNLAAN